jgi:hypothetical protein
LRLAGIDRHGADALLHASTLERNRAVQRSRETEERPASTCAAIVSGLTTSLCAVPLTLRVKAIVACKRNLRRRKDARVVRYLSNALL